MDKQQKTLNGICEIVNERIRNELNENGYCTINTAKKILSEEGIGEYSEDPWLRPFGFVNNKEVQNGKN